MFQNNFQGNKMNDQTNNIYDNKKYNTNYNTNYECKTLNIKRINNLRNSPNSDRKYEPKIIDRNKYIDNISGNERKTLNIDHNNIHNLSLYNPGYNNEEIKSFNIDTPYKTEKHYNFFSSERKTTPYQITEKKIIVPQKYDKNTFIYTNKNNRPDLNLNLGDLNLTLDQPPNFEYNKQIEYKKKNIPYKKVRVNPNVNNENYLSFYENNQSVIDYNLGNNGINELNLNLENSVYHNQSFDYYSSKSQSPAYKKKNITSFHSLNNNDRNINKNHDINNNSKKSNFSLFKERETEIYNVYAKKIQKIFRGYLSRKKFNLEIKMLNSLNIIDNILTDNLKKNVFEVLMKNNKNIENSNSNNNQKIIYKKKASILNKSNESFSIQRKRSNSGEIILVDETPAINYQNKLKEYELTINLLKEQNNQLRILNTQRYDNIQEMNLENQKLKEKYRNLSSDLDKTKEQMLNLELNNSNNESINNNNTNIKVIQIDNSILNSNDDIMNSSFGNPSQRNLMKLKNIYLKQFFWKKDAMNQKILPKYFERWRLFVEKKIKKEELSEKKESILLKYIRNRDNFLFLFMKEQFKKFLFNGIMKENIYLRKEQKKEFLDKIENEENDNMKKRKLLRFLVFGKIRANNNIMNQQFRKFYFNGLYNQMKNEKDIDLRKSMNIDFNLIKKQKEIKEDSLFNDEQKNKLNDNNEKESKQLNNDNNEENENKKNNKEDEKKKNDLLKKIFLKKSRNDKEFLHKSFIKFYYREIYRELVFKKTSSTHLSSSTMNNAVIPNSSNLITTNLNSTMINSTNLNSNNLNDNIINSINIISNSNIENPNVIIKNDELKNEKTENIEKEQNLPEISIEVNNEEIEQKNFTNRLQKARNLRKFLVNKEKEKKEKIRTYFYKFYKAGVIRVMRLEGKKRKASRQSSLNCDSNILNNTTYNVNNTYNENKDNNIFNTAPLITKNLLNSIELKTQELKMTKLEDLLYKKNRKIKLILKNVIENWNLKAHLFKLRRSSSGIKRRKSLSKGKKLSKHQSSKNVLPIIKDSKIKSKTHRVNLIPKCKSQSSLLLNDKDNNIGNFLNKIDEVILNYYKRIFYKYLEDLE